MYTRCTEAEVKEGIIVRSFCDLHGKMRPVIATIAFGMGLDCHNVRQILHWGPASDIESFVRETGCAEVRLRCWEQAGRAVEERWRQHQEEMERSNREKVRDL